MFLIQHPCFMLNKRITESIMPDSYQEYDPQSSANQIIHVWNLNGGIRLPHVNSCKLKLENFFYQKKKKKIQKEHIGWDWNNHSESCREKNTVDCSHPQREFQLRTAFHAVPSQKLHNAASCCNIVADLWTCLEKECENSATFFDRAEQINQ